MKGIAMALLALFVLQGCFASLGVSNTLPIGKTGAIHTHVGVGSDGSVRVGASASSVIFP